MWRDSLVFFSFSRAGFIKCVTAGTAFLSPRFLEYNIAMVGGAQFHQREYRTKRSLAYLSLPPITAILPPFFWQVLVYTYAVGGNDL